MLRAVIIDDEQKGIDALTILIGKYVTEINVVATAIAPQAAIKAIENYKPEIVFLDINMPVMTGFDILDRLSWREFNLVFVTAHREYALRALKSNAVDYLLKPVHHHDIIAVADRILKRVAGLEGELKYNYNQLLENIKRNQKQKIVISLRTGVESIDLENIICLESTSNYTSIRTVDKREIMSTRILKEFESQLCDKENHFMRVHQSFIINLNKVVRYRKANDDIIMCNEEKVPVSKSRRKAFFAWLDVK